MKKIKLLVYALIMCMSFVSLAEAKGRSGSFKSGFASQKRNLAKPAPTYSAPPVSEPTKKTAFGSFGTAAPKAQTNSVATPQSQMSKDLTDRNAQANAIKAADARTQTNAAPAASDSGWFRSGNENLSAQKPQATTLGQGINTNRQTFERRSSQHSNGFMQGLLWFMVGHSLAQQVSAAPHQQNIDGSSQANNSLNAEGTATQQVQDVPAVETESWFMKLMRVMLWAMVISGVIWAVRKAMGFRQRKLDRSTNYSLGS